MGHWEYFYYKMDGFRTTTLILIQAIMEDKKTNWVGQIMTK